MSNDEIFYQSDGKQITAHPAILETSEHEGVECTWSGSLVTFSRAKLNWKLNWDAIKAQGISRIHGTITTYMYLFGYGMYTDVVQVDSDKGLEYETKMDLEHGFSSKSVYFQYKLLCEPDYMLMFDGSDGKSDRVLLVDGKELHVNKEFLSYHSDFFQALFSQTWDQDPSSPIPINDVSYLDFGLLISMIHPMKRFPNDQTYDKLLQLADRFLMPTVTRQVEHHLLYISKLPLSQLLRTADQYKLEKLMANKIKKIGTSEDNHVLENENVPDISDEIEDEIEDFPVAGIIELDE